MSVEDKITAAVRRIQAESNRRQVLKNETALLLNVAEVQVLAGIMADYQRLCHEQWKREAGL